MLECPASRVLAEGAIEGRATDDVVAQREEHDGRLAIAEGTERPCVDAIRRRHQRSIDAILDRPSPVGDVTRVRGRTWRAPLQRERIDVGIDALVLPGVATFVGADDHREPLVPMLVVHRPEDRIGVVLRIAVVHHHEHRVLHPTDGAGHRRRLRIRILVEELRVVPDRPCGLLGGVLPRLARLDDLIVGLGEHAIGVGGIPPEIGRAGPRDVAHVQRAESPGTRTGRRRGVRLVVGDDGHGGVRARRARKALSLCGGEHIGGVLEDTAARDRVAGGRRDTVVDVAVLEIELALPEVRIGVPATDVVVHRHARVPLRDLVQRAVAAHAIGAVLRNAERVAHRDREPSALRRERLVEIDASHRVVDVHRRRTTVDLQAVDVVSAGKAAHAPARIGGEEHRALAAGPVEILVQLQPDEAQRVG